MPYCPECGKEVSSEVRYCPWCGAKLAIKKEEVNTRGIQEKIAETRHNEMIGWIITVLGAVFMILSPFVTEDTLEGFRTSLYLFLLGLIIAGIGGAISLYYSAVRDTLMKGEK